MWLYIFVAITGIVAASVKSQIIYESDNVPRVWRLSNNPEEMKNNFLSLMITSDRKAAENFIKLLTGVQNDFQSKLNNLSVELISVQNENREIKSNLQDLTKGLTDTQYYKNQTRPTVEAESKILDIQREIDLKIKEEFKKLESNIKANLTSRLEGSNIIGRTVKEENEMESMLSYLNNTQSELKSKVDRLGNVLEEDERWKDRVAMSSLDTWERNTHDLNDTLDDLQNNLFDINTNLSAIVNDVQTKTDILKQMESSISEQKEKLNETSKAVYKLKEHAHNNTIYIATVNLTAGIMRDELSVLETRLQALKNQTNYCNILEQLESSITEQKIKLNETSQAVYKLKEHAHNNTIDIATVNSTAGIMRNELSFLKTSLQALKNQTNYWNTDFTHVNSSIINNSRQIQENKIEINEYTSQLDYLQKLVKSQETKLQDLQNAVENVGSLPGRCQDLQKPTSCKDVAKVTGVSFIADGIRLVNGSSWSEGRVEVYESGSWGSICSTEWGTMDASVVCKVVGFKYGVPITSGLFGQGDGTVRMTNVSCDGSESSVFNCAYIHAKYCPKNQTAGVVCTNANPLRLVNGRTIAEGRVEIYTENSRGRGEWRAVSDKNWGKNEAQVVCQILGFPGYHTVPRAGYHFGHGTGEICLEDVHCNGTERGLLGCHYRWNSNCSHSGDAGVSCLAIRLMDGYDESEGRVEVLIDNEWGTICDDNWGENEATVVCRSLGLPSANAVAKRSAYFGPGSGAILLNGLNCSGRENGIEECSRIQSGLEKCGQENEAGVRCLRIRLTNKPDDKLSGLVEVYIKNKWGKVCGDNWTNEDAQVVCRHLGFPRHTAYILRNKFFEQNPERIWISNVQCLGSEQALLNCKHSTDSGAVSCTSRRAAGVNCAPLTLVGGPNEREGRVEVYTNQQWGTVCDTHWSEQEARVVCENLGYFGHHAIPRRSSFFGGGNGTIILTNVQCEGNVSSLLDCRHQVTISTNCSHNNDAGVSCLPVRLVGGQNDREGRVEVYLNNVWGTVCDDDWGHDDAQVVCQSLGFPNFTGVARVAAYYGQGSGPILLDNVRCNGNEVDIRNCSYTSNVNCGHSEDAGVICVPLRLADGTNGNEGRVEVYKNNQWGTVCDTNWGQNEAQVVCESLGYGRYNAVPRQSATFGVGVDDILLDNVRCSGRETDLMDCQYVDITSINCSHDNDAGVSCLPVRLIGGRNGMEGRVEIFMQNEWGTICDTLWDSRDGSVVCRSLGYEGFTGVPRYSSFYGKGSGRIWLQNSSCSGDETSIHNCIKSGIGVHQCNHSNDAGVKCVPIRLVNGSNVDEGRIEVYLGKQWSTICGQNWSDSEAHVVCKSLGFGRAIINDTKSFGEGKGDVLIQNFNCKGTESSILDCEKDDITVQNCSHYYDVGVKCSSVRLVNGTNSWEGLVEVYDGNSWKGLCAENWDRSEAQVVCRNVGLDGSTAVTKSFKITQKIIQMFPTYFKCRGHERNLFDCSHYRVPVRTGWFSYEECTHAGVRCIPVRLSGGFSNVQGRVEVFLNNVWGTICDAGWDSVDSRVICQSLLGNSYSGTKVDTERFGKGVDNILMANVACTGSESSVLECRHSLVTDHCSHSQDVAVECYQNIRLNNGRVEVYVDSQWGTVCANSWDDADAKVVCRSLGLPSNNADASRVYNYRIHGSMYYYNTLPILMGYVRCRGTESSLFDCSKYLGFYCSDSIAAVSCV